MKGVIIGDSISEGVGSQKINYVHDLEMMLSGVWEFDNLAKTGTTIIYGRSLLEELKAGCPDCVLIMYGSVDAQIRPNLSGNRWGITKMIPARYKIGGMLDPRSFYSTKWYRIIPDRIDNIVRKMLKQIVLRTEGVIQWVSLDQFREKYEYVVSDLINAGIRVLCVSTVYLDDEYFLNSNVEYSKYNKVIEEIAKKYGASYINLFDALREEVVENGWNELYSHDHFHPNINGYKFISEIFAKEIKVVNHPEGIYSEN